MNCIIFSVNRDFDSWDIENLKYIRKISIRDDDGGEKEDVSHPAPRVIGSTERMKKVYPIIKPTQILEEAPPFLQKRKCPELSPEYSCYLMDVVLVTNESLPISTEHQEGRRHSYEENSPTRSPSVSSTDSFASAIQKGFFEMERKVSTGQKVGGHSKTVRFQDGIHPTKTLSSMLEEGAKREPEHKANTYPVVKKTNNSLNVEVQRRISLDLEGVKVSHSFNGRLVGSEHLQEGYANNWAHLENYVKLLNSNLASSSRS